MSGLAIAFPAELAARVAQLVIDGAADAAGPLLLLAVGVTLLLLGKPYAMHVAALLRGPLGRGIERGIERLKHLAH